MRSLKETYSEATDQWEALQSSSVPVLYVGAATCGRAAGAGNVIKRLEAEIRDKRIDAKVVEVGCLGLCCFEPLVVVHKPGSPQVCYGKVSPDKIAGILEKHVLGDDPCAKWALGTMTPGELGGIGKFSEHPMMTGQVRHVLRNCGWGRTKRSKKSRRPACAGAAGQDSPPGRSGNSVALHRANRNT